MNKNLLSTNNNQNSGEIEVDCFKKRKKISFDYGMKR